MGDTSDRYNRGEHGVIFLSDAYATPYRTIKITDGETGMVYDVSDYALNFRVILPATEALPTAEVVLDNSEGEWLDIFDAGDVLEIWADYEDGLTTKIFKGKVTNCQYSLDMNGYLINIESKSCPELSDQLIIQELVNQLGSDGIKAIIDDHFSGVVTYTNVSALTTRITNNYSNVSGWSAIVDICKRCNADCYIDNTGDLHVFSQNSIKSEETSIAIGVNLKGIDRFGKDYDILKNRVTVYGEEDGGIVYLKTEEDIPSQTDVWRKDEVVSDSTLKNMTLVQEKANAELSITTSLPDLGNLSALGLQVLNPGEQVDCQVPYCGVSGWYRIQTLTHIWDEGGFYSTIDINERTINMSKLFKDRIDAEKVIRPFVNLNDMTNSYTIDFINEITTPTWTYENTEVSEQGYLIVTSPASDGKATSPTTTSENNITQCEVRYLGNYPDTEEDEWEVCNDDGLNWEGIVPGSGQIFTFTTAGNQLKVRIKKMFVGATYSKICVLYK
jgi:hypothetical protein